MHTANLTVGDAAAAARRKAGAPGVRLSQESLATEPSAHVVCTGLDDITVVIYTVRSNTAIFVQHLKGRARRTRATFGTGLMDT